MDDPNGGKRRRKPKLVTTEEVVQLETAPCELPQKDYACSVCKCQPKDVGKEHQSVSALITLVVRAEDAEFTSWASAAMTHFIDEGKRSIRRAASAAIESKVKKEVYTGWDMLLARRNYDASGKEVEPEEWAYYRPSGIVFSKVLPDERKDTDTPRLRLPLTVHGLPAYFAGVRWYPNDLLVRFVRRPELPQRDEDSEGKPLELPLDQFLSRFQREIEGLVPADAPEPIGGEPPDQPSGPNAGESGTDPHPGEGDGPGNDGGPDFDPTNWSPEDFRPG